MGEPLNPRRRLPAGLLLTLVLALEAVVLLSPATIGGEAFFRRDVHLMWAAQAEAYAQAWRDGSWPLWSSRISFGQPLLADANTQVLYPATLLHLVLPPWTYYTVYAVLHLVLAGLGASLLARVLGLGRTASAAAGALWMASGPLLSVIDTWNQLAGAAWMPWSIAAGLARCPAAERAGRSVGRVLRAADPLGLHPRRCCCRGRESRWWRWLPPVVTNGRSRAWPGRAAAPRPRRCSRWACRRRSGGPHSTRRAPPDGPAFRGRHARTGRSIRRTWDRPCVPSRCIGWR